MVFYCIAVIILYIGRRCWLVSLTVISPSTRTCKFVFARPKRINKQIDWLRWLTDDVIGWDSGNVPIPDHITEDPFAKRWASKKLDSVVSLINLVLLICLFNSDRNVLESFLFLICIYYMNIEKCKINITFTKEFSSQKSVSWRLKVSRASFLFPM